jgi:chromosomal replication initiator protein
MPKVPEMLTSLWDRMLTELERRLPASALDSWLRPCRLAALDGDDLRIAAPNKYTRDWLMQNHLGALETAAREIFGGNPRVSIVIDSALPASHPAHSAPALDPQSLPSGLSTRYTFDSFVVGNSNQFAQAACQAVAELPSKAYNPLFIYGGVGLGKTHLLHAVGHQIARLYPSLRLLYLSTERFTNELINAIRYDRTAEFRAKYRTIDLLLIDDIQFISGKERTQEEFFHTFNDLYEARHQIVLSSDSPPKEIPEIEERLRSRFEWGLIADIQPPDFETRVAILKKKAAIERILLPDDVAYLIASRIKANIREIEGSLTRMIAFCSLSGRDMNTDLAQEVLADLWSEEEKVITIEQIQRKAADFFGVKLSDMRAKGRTKAIAFPRQIAMYLARQLTHASLAEVGRAFGGKDHTTVLHAVEKIQNLLNEDPKFKKTIDSITQSFPL